MHGKTSIWLSIGLWEGKRPCSTAVSSVFKEVLENLYVEADSALCHKAKSGTS